VCQYLYPYVFSLWTKVHHVRRLEYFGEDIPTSRDVIEAHILNIKPNFKFSQLKFLGDPVTVGDGLGSLGQSVTSVKI